MRSENKIRGINYTNFIYRYHFYKALVINFLYFIYFSLYWNTFKCRYAATLQNIQMELVFRNTLQFFAYMPLSIAIYLCLARHIFWRMFHRTITLGLAGNTVRLLILHLYHILFLIDLDTESNLQCSECKNKYFHVFVDE